MTEGKQNRKLVCPHCGWDGTEPGDHWHCFRYLEEVTNEREVCGYNAQGTLLIAGQDHIAIEDGGTNHRLLCGNCLEEFPLPEGEVDFV